MKRLLPLTSVTTTSVAFAALCAGAGVANADGCSQTNLVSDARPRNDNRLQPGEPLGCLVRERGVPSGFRTRAQIWPRFIR